MLCFEQWLAYNGPAEEGADTRKYALLEWHQWVEEKVMCPMAAIRVTPNGDTHYTHAFIHA